MRLDLADLRLFIAIVDTGSITAERRMPFGPGVRQ